MSSLLYVKLKKEINLKQRSWRIVQPKWFCLIIFWQQCQISTNLAYQLLHLFKIIIVIALL